MPICIGMAPGKIVMKKISGDDFTLYRKDQLTQKRIVGIKGHILGFGTTFARRIVRQIQPGGFAGRDASFFNFRSQATAGRFHRGNFQLALFEEPSCIALCRLPGRYGINLLSSSPFRGRGRDRANAAFKTRYNNTLFAQ